ncbi:hypothetical protein Tco_1520125 [Tanacetum coccineum]
MVMNTPYPKSDNNVLMLKSKGLDNIQVVNTPYPMDLDTPYWLTAKTDSVKFENNNYGLSLGSAFVYSEVFKLDLSSASFS